MTYLGEVTDIKKLLIDKHIVSVCSSKEAFGRVTVEAMLAGCLVIGADSGGTSSILNDQNYGFLYTPDNLESYVEKLYNSIIKYPEYQSKLQSAQTYAREVYSLENNYNSIIEIYKKIRMEPE